MSTVLPKHFNIATKTERRKVSRVNFDLGSIKSVIFLCFHFKGSRFVRERLQMIFFFLICDKLFHLFYLLKFESMQTGCLRFKPFFYETFMHCMGQSLAGNNCACLVTGPSQAKRSSHKHLYSRHGQS